MGNKHLAPQTLVLHCNSPCEDAVQVLQGFLNPNCRWEYPFLISIVYKRKQVIAENLEKAEEITSEQLV